MNKKRVFSEKELNEMGRRTLDLVLEAIEAGNKEKAKELAQRMYRELNFLHDGFMIWVSGLLTYIYNNHGIDALEEAEREAHTIEAKIAFKPSEKTDVRSRVEDLVRRNARASAAHYRRGRQRKNQHYNEALRLWRKDNTKRRLRFGNGPGQSERAPSHYLGNEGFPYLLCTLPGGGNARN